MNIKKKGKEKENYDHYGAGEFYCGAVVRLSDLFTSSVSILFAFSWTGCTICLIFFGSYFVVFSTR